MKFSRLLLVLLVAALFSSVIPAAAQAENTLVITSLSDISTLDPAVGYDTLSWPMISLFYRGLVTMSDGQTPEPALAESWTVSDDGLVYTFTLREGTMFSNGREVTADDVKYTFERLFAPETASPTAYFYDMIAGAAEFTAGEADSVSGIVVLDPRTVEFTLTRPEWTLMQRFALAPGGIVASEGVEAAGEDFGRQPLGAGPFMLESWTSGVSLIAVRNPNYYREGFPLVDGIEIQLGVDPAVGILRIENGEADLSLDFVPNSDYPRITVDSVLAENLVESTAFANTQYLFPNFSVEQFTSLEVRQAMSMAIDRDRLVTIYNNRAVPATGPVPASVVGNNADLTPVYDPDAARELLAAAGYADGFTTTIVSTTDPTDVAIAQAIIEDWAQVGIQADLLSVDFAQWLDIAYNQPDQMPVGYIGWFMDYPDPANVFEPLLTCGGSFNPGGFCDEAFDEQFTAANLLPPGDDRWSAFAALEAAAYAGVGNINLLHVRNFYYTSARVENLIPDAATLLNFELVSVGGN